MRDARQVARELLAASLKAADSLGIPTDNEELDYLTPIVEQRDLEVANHVLSSLDLAFGLEAEGRTGPAAWYLQRARTLVAKVGEGFSG